MKSVQITIRDVPIDVKGVLATRAARAGKSMQEYLREHLEHLAERPTIEEWLERTRHRKAASGHEISANLILEHRDADRRS